MPPSATTIAATGVTGTTATLNGIGEPRRARHDLLLPVRHDHLLRHADPDHPDERRSRERARVARVGEPHRAHAEHDLRLPDRRRQQRREQPTAEIKPSPPRAAPSATTNAATGITDTARHPQRLGEPERSRATTYYFQYGLTTAYGTQIPATQAPARATQRSRRVGEPDGPRPGHDL